MFASCGSTIRVALALSRTSGAIPLRRIGNDSDDALVAGWGGVINADLGAGLLPELADVGAALPDDAACFGGGAEDSE